MLWSVSLTGTISPRAERGEYDKEEKGKNMKEIEREDYSWQEMADLTHATQVQIFQWCGCEEQEEFPYADCPREKVGA